jgi:hypothetical protein
MRTFLSRRAAAPQHPPVASEPPCAAQRPEPIDYTGWYVSSLELRQGLSVVDLDDPDLHRLFR